MARIIKSGLIQMSLPKTEGEGMIEEIKEAMVQKHIPLIEEAGEKGVQILCFKEIFWCVVFLHQTLCRACSGNGAGRRPRGWPSL